MLNTITNVVIILVLLFASFTFWNKGKRKKEKGLLLRIASLFILLHLVVFPIIYVFLIKNDPNSIEIDNQILSNEKKEKLASFHSNYNELDIENRQKIIGEVLKNENHVLKDSEIVWTEYYSFFEDEEDSYGDLIEFKNCTLFFYMRFKETPATPFGRFIIVYPKNKKIRNFELNGSFEMGAKEILQREYEKLESLKEDKTNEFQRIKANKSWSYKEVLPYTINILFTDSFKPRSRFSQFVYFIHTMIVSVFLLGFIVGISQNQITQEKKS